MSCQGFEGERSFGVQGLGTSGSGESWRPRAAQRLSSPTSGVSAAGAASRQSASIAPASSSLSLPARA